MLSSFIIVSVSFVSFFPLCTLHNSKQIIHNSKCRYCISADSEKSSRFYILQKIIEKEILIASNLEPFSKAASVQWDIVNELEEALITQKVQENCLYEFCETFPNTNECEILRRKLKKVKELTNQFKCNNLHALRRENMTLKQHNQKFPNRHNVH